MKNWYKAAMGGEDLELPSDKEVSEYALKLMEEIETKEQEEDIHRNLPWLREVSLKGFSVFGGDYFNLKESSVPYLIRKGEVFVRVPPEQIRDQDNGRYIFSVRFEYIPKARAETVDVDTPDLIYLRGHLILVPPEDDQSWDIDFDNDDYVSVDWNTVRISSKMNRPTDVNDSSFQRNTYKFLYEIMKDEALEIKSYIELQIREMIRERSAERSFRRYED